MTDRPDKNDLIAAYRATLASPHGKMVLTHIKQTLCRFDETLLANDMTPDELVAKAALFDLARAIDHLCTCEPQERPEVNHERRRSSIR